jgi:hypothetical protein
MAFLALCKFENGQLVLQGSEDGTRNTDFSLFDVDGEGGDPFAFGNRNWEQIEEVDTSEYDPTDTDTFWQALEVVLKSARKCGIELPEHAAY